MAIFLTNNDDKVSYITAVSPLVIFGLDGNDTIIAGNESDYVDGGNGNDIISDLGGLVGDHFIGGSGNDVLYAIAGDDWLEGNSGNDALNGGNDNDLLDGGTGKDLLDGDDGNDTLIADGSFVDGFDQLFGGNGNDVYVLSGLNFTIADDSGIDRLEISLTASLANLVGIENLTLTGNAAINGYGDALGNDINGNGAANILDGGNGNDLIRGYGGNDTLIGGLGGGVEYLYGGTGDDTFIVYDTQDTPVEFGGQGIDTVNSSVRFVLGDNIENLILRGAASVNGFGNALGNQLTGNTGNNYLQGYAGRDALVGGLGNDYYELSDLANTGIFAGYQYDVVTEGVNAGIDTESVTAIDNPNTFFGVETFTLDANIENGIIQGSISFNLSGNELNNVLTGNAAANTLNGFAGNDTMLGGLGLDTLGGGLGNDAYYLDDTNVSQTLAIYRYDSVTELAGAGIDWVFVNADQFTSTLTSSYSLGANVENARVTGIGSFYLYGNELDNSLNGNSGVNRLTGYAGHDRLDGGLGEDSLFGGLGNDTYVLNDTNRTQANFILHYDAVTEDVNGGNDNVFVNSDAPRSSVGTGIYTLGANIENGFLTGTNNFNLTGNETGNILTGNIAANTLTGLGGNDLLRGGLGSDILRGGIGADQLTGGAGLDQLYGEVGSDQFIFAALSDSGVGLGLRDIVRDFSIGDLIVLNGIDANAVVALDQAFVLDTNGNFGIGEIGLLRSGADLVVRLNTDADAAAEMEILVLNRTSLGAGDFLL